MRKLTLYHRNAIWIITKVNQAGSGLEADCNFSFENFYLGQLPWVKVTTKTIAQPPSLKICFGKMKKKIKNYWKHTFICFFFLRAYNFGPSGLPPSYSRSLYPPLGDMSNYSEKCDDEYVKKDGKYWERRRKNNLAAKKSRDSRRIRENQMRLRVMCLENANQMLKEEMERKDVEISNLK